MGVFLSLIGRGVAWFAGSALGKVLFDYTIGYLTDWVKKRKAIREVEESIDAEADKKIDILENTKTMEDKKNAMDDILNRL